MGKKNWYRNYSEAKKYKEKNGYISDNKKIISSTGFDIGGWIFRQKKQYEAGLLEENQIELLKELGIELSKEIHNNIPNNWLLMYELAKEYYNRKGDIDIPFSFKTKDGYTYDEDGKALGKWVHDQRIRRKKGYLSSKQIELLDDLAMIWDKSKLQEEIITEKNIGRKRKEILNSVKLYLLGYKYKDLPSKDEINRGLLLYLDKNKRL